jgi:hypothetical protein
MKRDDIHYKKLTRPNHLLGQSLFFALFGPN